MSKHKHIDRICAAAMALALALTILFMNGEALGIEPASRAMGYEERLFDTTRVHTIEILMDDWDGFLEACENEEYAACSVVIDNEAFHNVGLRAKGNTSLSTVSSLGSRRYSFKIEFDQYDGGKTYYGLDKLCLNNVIQDNTYMKDYLTYRLMEQFGAAAPLCSFVYITVNGEDWGLYLAVEGVEDGFLQRNYGRDHGALYKPDSMGFGGGRGNGMDFDMDDFLDQDVPSGGMPVPEGTENLPAGSEPGRIGAEGGEPPEGAGPFGGGGASGPEGPGLNGGQRGGAGSSDVKLQYTDDSPDSYSNIFNSAKTDVSQADQDRLIRSLKALGEGDDVESVLDVDQVLRYFVVHNFVVNGDSYTGSMVHNYYLYEKDGRLSMIPWDYNLAFGTFQGNDASSAVNDPIDSPLSVTGDGDRPMADWIFSDGEYTRLYHQYFQEFLDGVDAAAIIDQAYGLIAPYVERDPTKFCTTEEFQAGVEALKAFCRLRVESVSGQLAGTIPSTDEGQDADRDALVDASGLDLSQMGTMGGGGPAGGGGFPGGGQPEDGGQPAFNSVSGTGGQPEAGQAPNASPGGRGEAGPQGMEQPGQAPDAAGSALLLGISVLALLLGLLIAFQFKRR